MLGKLNEFVESHGELKPRRGLGTGVIALTLGILSFPGVLAFHFPEYLTTPQLRKSYLFGTAVKSTRLWPQAYGVLGDHVPKGFVRQLKFPFVWKG